MKMPQLTNKKGTMKIKCIKCNKKHDEQNMCLSINDIIENHVKEKTINDFEKNYLKGMSIENAFCGTCASQSLKIMEGKLTDTSHQIIYYECTVKANSKKEAIAKANNWEEVDSDCTHNEIEAIEIKN